MIRRLGALLALLGVPALLVSATASAHFDVGERYTHRACPATPTTRIDPVNVVFHGWGTWGRAVSQIESHAGWTATSGSGQWFVDHGSCFASTGSARAAPDRASTSASAVSTGMPCSGGP